MFAHSILIPTDDDAADWHALWQQLPASAAVFALHGPSDKVDDEPYITKTANLRRRLKRLLSPDTTASKRLNLLGRVSRISYTETGSDLETALLLYTATRHAFGDRVRKRLHLRPPALLRMAWENAHPRVYATNRVAHRALEHTFGPFPSRVAAERFLDDSLNLFFLRRCTDDLHPDPAFPGCIYSEMKMCLAPCFLGCTEARYAEESEAVRAYFATRGASLLTALEQDRNAASAALDFERAAQLHARIQKVKAIAQQAAPLVHPLAQLDAVILQPAFYASQAALSMHEMSAPDMSSTGHAAHVAVFLIRAGMFYGPALYSVQGMAHPNEQSGSSSLFAHPVAQMPTPLQASETAAPKAARGLLEDRLRDLLRQLEMQASASRPHSDRIADHLALLARWYYRPAAKRTGEIFFRDASSDFPLPKILRGISRVARGARNPEDAEAATIPILP